MFFLRVILLPIAFLYGIATKTRNILFDIGILKSKKYKTKSISVGNITVGGTGKSPHIEYLIRLLNKEHKIAVLSRGYQRKTKGYLVANKDSTYKDIGDEPMQFHSKFNSVTVAVDEDRQRGIENIEKYINPDVILLDDCYQHRWVKPDVNILLLDYSTIGKKQFMLPSGELREWQSGKKRANLIVITKSPKLHSPIEHRRISSLIQPLRSQNIFFSYIDYDGIRPFNYRAEDLFKKGVQLENFKTLVFAGIAKITPLVDYLRQESKEVFVTKFKDHQNFEPIDMVRIVKKFNEIIGTKKIVITTEKDAMRLHDPRLFPLLEDVPVFFLPIKIKFHKGLDEEGNFDKIIRDYVQ
ncbi:MAG: tetraacyldisaccharide 4'-kinase [Flavobacteriales bacterium]|nr:tetraacyldisaccharide 4'-kinase [Flavobacteriales bacterium]|tara:strand:+ start:6458 stop:7519 length:1062 start_codon:yes stop_codon:yes gene_type:complete